MEKNETVLHKRIGKILRQIRHLNEMNQKQASEKSNVHSQTISLIERGETNLTLDTLFRLLDCYNYHVVDFFQKVFEI